MTPHAKFHGPTSTWVVWANSQLTPRCKFVKKILFSPFQVLIPYRVEYLIPTYNIFVLLLHSNLTKKIPINRFSNAT